MPKKQHFPLRNHPPEARSMHQMLLAVFPDDIGSQ
jgi:hypothetical protein